MKNNKVHFSVFFLGRPKAGQDLKIPIRGERDQIIEEVVNLGSDLDFELNTQNVKQCLQFDERHLSSED